MSLTALLFAAAMASPVATETPNLWAVPEHCRPKAVETAGAERPPARPTTRMPPANLHLAVDRRVGGCPVPVIVRYGVDGAPGAFRDPRRGDGLQRRR